MLHEIEHGGAVNRVRERESGGRMGNVTAALAGSGASDSGSDVANSGGAAKTKVLIDGEKTGPGRKKITYRGSFVKYNKNTIK